LLPPWFDLTTLLLILAVALPRAIEFRRRPRPEDTARLVDDETHLMICF
jgi:hypothetical protein